MKKLSSYLSLTFALLLILVLSSCGSPFEYDRDDAVKNTQQLIEKVNSGDYQAIFDRMHESVQLQVPVEKLRDAWEPPLSSAGAFVEFQNATTKGATQDSVNYIVVVIPCRHENNTLKYTFTFTEDYEIASLEMK